jgi:hypothetical protein
VEPDPKNQLAPAIDGAYIKSIAELELRQSEIISGLLQHEYYASDERVTSTEIPYAIVMTQDCDLLRDFESLKTSGQRVLNGMLVYELQPAVEAKPQLRGISWQPLSQNINERFHFFSAVPPDCDLLGVGLPELVLDFRRYFTLPTSEAYRQMGDGQNAKRRCRLNSPYREQLQNRAGFYFQRVALP